MRSRNNAHTRMGFEHYISEFRRRFRFKTVATALAALIFVAVVVSLATVVFGDRLAYSAWLYWPARLLLALSAVGILLLMLWLPLRIFKRTDGIAEIEARVPTLQGRAETWADLQKNNDRSPFAGLLARDAAHASRAAPINRLLPRADVYGPLAAIALLLLMLAWLYGNLPANMRAGMAHLWVGWFKTDLLPERTIEVEPGNKKLRYGDTATFTATLGGFASAYSTLHLREQDGAWSELEMTPMANGSFSFSLYGVTSALEYYVTSSYIRSDNFTIDVVIPARLESLDFEYRYPEWTGLEPKRVENGTQIAAISGTRVELRFSTDRALRNGVLIHNNIASDVEKIETAIAEQPFVYRASLIVDVEGEYQLVDMIEGDRIALSEEYPIIILEDQQPEITFKRPGADWSASPIEEVTVVAEANDDFAVEGVTLHYSVNGGGWDSIDLGAEQPLQHVFELEEFGQDEPLIPGDLVSYYAEAHDRQHSVSTDIMFIDVAPFERRFSQSQQSGQGGGQGQQEQEISQRQKEILVATWNLIREEREQTETLIKAEDSAALLADLQSTLANQADTLAQRAESRQLLDDDPEIARFVEYMQQAAESMRPSATSLTTLELDEAVKHQQRALQFLKRAESVFNDIQISQNQSGGSGGAGSDMAEMYELEMDLAKNQYETPDAAQPGDQQQAKQEDEAFERLKDLAHRQQQLAEAARRNAELSMAERWQQERLQREIEELQRELQEQQQQASNAHQQKGQQGQQQPGQPQQGQQQSQQQQGPSEGEQSSGQQQTKQAIQGLQQALDQLRTSEDNPQSSEVLDNASRELQESLERLGESRQQQLDQQLADATETARELTREQRETASELREALRRAMQARQEGTLDSGLDEQQTQQLAEQKRRMQRDLETLREQLAQTAERFDEQMPGTAASIRNALEELDRDKIAEQIGIAGDMIDEGRAPQAALREQQITEALTKLQNNLVDSRNTALAESQEPAKLDQRTVADASRAVQQMREALQQAIRSARQPSRQTQNEPASSSQEVSQNPTQAAENQPGQSSGQQAQQSGSQQHRSQQGSASTKSGQPRSGIRQGQQMGAAPGRNYRYDDLPGNDRNADMIEQARLHLEQTLPDINTDLNEGIRLSLEQLTRDMSRQGADAESDGSDSSGENSRRINREVGILLRQLEQLELALNRATKGEQLSAIRSVHPGSDPEGFDIRAAEYFRRLGESRGAAAGS